MFSRATCSSSRRRSVPRPRAASFSASRGSRLRETKRWQGSRSYGSECWQPSPPCTTKTSAGSKPCSRGRLCTLPTAITWKGWKCTWRATRPRPPGASSRRRRSIPRLIHLVHPSEHARLRLLRDRLAPFDRARLDFVVALRAGDLLERYRAALRLVDAAPGSIDARRELALSALEALRPREALRRLEELDLKSGLMRGWEGDYWFFASEAHHLLGEYEEELAAVRHIRQFYPAAPFTLFEAPRALAALGRIAEVDSMARAELPGSGHADFIAFNIAGELMAHGHPEAVQRLARYVSDHPGAPPPSEPVAAGAWLYDHRALQARMGIPWGYVAHPLRARSVAQRARDEWVHWRAELALLLGDAEIGRAHV